MRRNTIRNFSMGVSKGVTRGFNAAKAAAYRGAVNVRTGYNQFRQGMNYNHRMQSSQAPVAIPGQSTRLFEAGRRFDTLTTNIVNKLQVGATIFVSKLPRAVQGVRNATVRFGNKLISISRAAGSKVKNAAQAAYPYIIKVVGKATAAVRRARGAVRNAGDAVFRQFAGPRPGVKKIPTIDGATGKVKSIQRQRVTNKNYRTQREYDVARQRFGRGVMTAGGLAAYGIVSAVANRRFEEDE